MAVKKGKAFERETAAIAGKYGKVIPKSGAYGTTDGIPQMAGDVRWMLPWFDSEIHLECKHGYSDKGQERKSMRIERQWFDKHLKQAKALNFHPAFAFKFKFTHENGMSKFVCFPFSTMEKLITQMENMYLELEELRNEQKKRAKKTA
ncbi:MAG: hypothetical protein WC196_07005 [Bacilli bacterium]